MLQKLRLSLFNLLIPLILCSLLLSLGMFNIHQQRRQNRQRAVTFAREYELSQKLLLSFVVRTAVDLIRFKQSQVEQRVRLELKSRVYEANRVAEGLYSQHPGVGDAEMQKLILAALGAMRFNEGRGYYFVYTLQGRELLAAAGPRPDTAGPAPAVPSSVIAEMARIVRTQGEGFCSYSWSKPGRAGPAVPKNSFVMGFAPFAWLIGAGEYEEDMRAQVQQEVIDWIEHMRFSEQGYLWIHDTDLRMIVHPYYPRQARPAWYTSQGLSDFADPSGRRLFREMLDVCREYGCGYVRYLWTKPDQPGWFEKLSYVELIDGWNWIVGAGVYIDELQKAIRRNEAQIDQQTRRQLGLLVLLVAGLLLVSAALTRFFHLRVRAAFALFSRHFHSAARDQKKIDPRRLHFAEFQRLALYVNEMVDAQRAAAEELRSKEKRLQQSQKMEAIGQLAGGIAHDFGNLIMAIHGHAELLSWEAALPEEAKAGLREILKTSEKAGSLIHQLLAFSRKQVVQPLPVDLNLVLADLGDMLRRVIGEHIRLLTELEGGLGLIEADPVQIEQLVVNLALNARDAMPAGGSLKISTRNLELTEALDKGSLCLRPGGYVLLELADTGTGMDAHTIEHAFEPFFTTKPEGKGTGLGLSTVYGIVKQSGGQIHIASQPGAGAVFSIYFPRRQKELLEQAAGPQQAREPARGQTILLVEDEQIVRETIARTLEKLGFAVLQADSGRQALRLLEAEAGVDLILLDLIMPDMGGVEVADRIPAAHKDKPILFMTGYPATRTLGDRPFVQKPFSSQALQARIGELLR